MQTLDQFQNFNIDQLEIDELVALKAFGEQLRSQYKDLSLDEPTWVGDNLKTLGREIRMRNADRIDKLIRDKRSRIAALATPAEKRTKLEEELAQLEKMQAGS